MGKFWHALNVGFEVLTAIIAVEHGGSGVVGFDYEGKSYTITVAPASK